MPFIRSAFLRDLQKLPAKRKRKRRSILTVASHRKHYDNIFYVNNDRTGDVQATTHGEESMRNGRKRPKTMIVAIDTDTDTRAGTDTHNHNCTFNGDDEDEKSSPALQDQDHKSKSGHDHVGSVNDGNDKIISVLQEKEQKSKYEQNYVGTANDDAVKVSAVFQEKDQNSKSEAYPGPDLEKIIQSKSDAQGNILFFCKWKGYDSQENSWETKNDLLVDGFAKEVETFLSREFQNGSERLSNNENYRTTTRITSSTSSPGSVKSNLGDKVLAHINGHWSNGTIVSVNQNGTYEIFFDDSVRSNVDVKDIRFEVDPTISENKTVTEKQQDSVTYSSNNIISPTISMESDTRILGISRSQDDHDEQDSNPRRAFEKSLVYRPRTLKGIKYKINNHCVLHNKYLVSLETSRWSRYIGVFNDYTDAENAGLKLLESIVTPLQKNRPNIKNESAAGTDYNSTFAKPAMEESDAAIFRDSAGYLEIRTPGRLITDGDDRYNYHTKKFLYPVGFCSVRSYFSISNPSEKVEYFCEIHEGDCAPRFVVYESGNSEMYEADSSSGAWKRVLERLNQRRKQLGMPQGQRNISGPQMYGFNIPQVRAILESLPSVSECKNYDPGGLKISNDDSNTEEGNTSVDRKIVKILNGPKSSLCRRDEEEQIYMSLV
mmetsp:Transcript_21040/g.25566  ORF Transcript_21040/g.25566 Transcript_21040/m.25566 type:complete len:660 (-) Transcript_21040:1342-3321(-)